jgi:hypothetical protein
VLECIIKTVPGIWKGQRIVIANLSESFGNEAVVSSSSEHDINKKEDLNSFKLEHTHFISSLNKTPESLEESPLRTN